MLRVQVEVKVELGLSTHDRWEKITRDGAVFLGCCYWESDGYGD